MKSHLHNNRLLKHDSNQANAVYTYDAHGNMLTMPHLPKMEWDSVDHLHKSVRGNDTTWYKYDVDGNRRRKITDKPGGIKEERIYHGDYELYRKYVNDVLQEETRTVHVSDGEKRIATVDYKTIENGVAITSFNDIVRCQYDNHLGSACLELDNNANVITYEEYHPFGTSSYKLADNDTEVKRKRYRYVGKERDEETGLYYYGARYYAAWIARFVSVDPMANQRTWVSPYNYCQNNPINKIDPNGALDEDPPKGANPELYQEDNDVLNSNKGTNLNGNPYAEEIRTNSSLKFATQEEEKAYNDYKNTIDENINNYKNEINNTTSIKKINYYQSQIKIFNSIKNELLAIENSKDVVFRLRMGKNITSNSGGGNLTYNYSFNELDINIDNIGDFNKIQKIAHELKHAYQYLNLELDFGYSHFSDIYDEVDAFDRQNLFATNTKEYIPDTYEFVMKNYKNKVSYTDGRHSFSNLSEAEQQDYRNVNAKNAYNNMPPKTIYIGWEKDYNKFKRK